jgi:hypothetical protein
LGEATAENYLPEGWTAMRDAIGYTIRKMKATCEDGPDVSYLIMVISDGEENASKHVQVGELRDIIGGLDKRWTVTYMGCDDKYLKQVSEQTGIKLSNMAKWANAAPQQVNCAMGSNRRRVAKYFDGKFAGLDLEDNFYSDTAAIADFTTPDTTIISAPAAPAAMPMHVAPMNCPTNWNTLHDGHSAAVGVVQMSTTAGPDIFSNTVKAGWEAYEKHRLEEFMTEQNRVGRRLESDESKVDHTM